MCMIASFGILQEFGNKLDLYDVIFVWQGSEANKMEKITAANVIISWIVHTNTILQLFCLIQFAGQLRDSEKAGRAEIHVVDENQRIADADVQGKLAAVLPYDKQNQVWFLLIYVGSPNLSFRSSNHHP